MVKFQYPKGMIPMTGGYMKNNPSDNYPMGVAKDMFGGFQVVSSIEDMLKIHPNYLISGYTACLVTEGSGGFVEMYYLRNKPTNSDGTVLDDWYKSQLGVNAEAMKFKGKLDPQNYTISDTDQTNTAGDLYIVETPTAIEISDPSLLSGVATIVRNTDWIIHNGLQFIHINQQALNLITWDTLTGKPSIIRDLELGKLPGHSHAAENIEIAKLVGGTAYTTLAELLNVIVYSNSIASSISTAKSTQLLTLEQLEAKYVNKDGMATELHNAVTNELSNYFTKKEITAKLAKKQSILSDEDVKTKLLNNSDVNVLTDSEYKKVKEGTTGGGAKIVLKSIEPLDNGVIEIITREDLPGEPYITEITPASTSVRCTFKFSTMNSLYGSFSINGEVFDKVSRVGDSEVFEGVVDLDIANAGEITVTGDAATTILINDTPPLIFSASLPSLELPKTHYPDGELIPITLTLDPSVSSIQVIGKNGIATSQQIPVTILDDRCTVDLEVSHATGPDLGSCKIIPYSGEQLGQSFSINDIPIDDTTPDISCNLEYVNGYYALKDTEVADIDITGISYDEILVSSIDNTYLQTELIAPAKVSVSKVGGVDVITPITITAIKHSNQKTVSKEVEVTIYDKTPELLRGIHEVKSGEPNLINLFVDDTKVSSINQLSADFGEATVKSGKVELTLDDSVPHDGATFHIHCDIVTISGRTIPGLQIPVKIVGFSERTATLNYPDLSFTLPFNILNPGNVKMSGTINSTPEFEIVQFELNGVEADGFTIEGDMVSLKPELESFGYNMNNSLTIKIQE